MDNSDEIHTPEETLGPQEKKSKKSDHKSKSKSDKPATESCSITDRMPVEVRWHVQDWDGHWSASLTIQEWGSAQGPLLQRPWFL